MTSLILNQLRQTQPGKTNCHHHSDDVVGSEEQWEPRPEDNPQGKATEGQSQARPFISYPRAIVVVLLLYSPPSTPHKPSNLHPLGPVRNKERGKKKKQNCRWFKFQGSELQQHPTGRERAHQVSQASYTPMSGEKFEASIPPYSVRAIPQSSPWKSFSFCLHSYSIPQLRRNLIGSFIYSFRTVISFRILDILNDLSIGTLDSYPHKILKPQNRNTPQQTDCTGVKARRLLSYFSWIICGENFRIILSTSYLANV